MTDYKLEQQHVAEVKYGGYASGNELVWTRGAGLQFLPAGTKLYAASIHAPTPVAYLDVGAGGYMYLGTDLTEDQVGSIPWGRHILAIVGTYGADGHVPAERPFDYTDAYQGARYDLAIWKRRALEAERRVREQDQINGPTFMGEPLLPKQPAEQKPDQSICDFYEATDYPSLVRELVGHVKQLQEAAMRNVKPWEDTFPPTLLPSYIKRIESADAEQQPAPDVARLVEALEFYAKGEHFTPYEPDQWDTVSGEPLNFLHHDDGADGSAGFVENGSIAKAALAAHRKGGE